MIINSELNTCFELSKIRAKMVLNHLSTIIISETVQSPSRRFILPLLFNPSGITEYLVEARQNAYLFPRVTILLTQMRSLFFVTSQIRVLRSYSPLDKGPFKYSLGFMRTVKNSEFTLRDENELVGSVKLSATVFCFMVD